MKKLLGRVVAGASLAVVVAGVPVAVHAATLNLKQQRCFFSWNLYL